jgi:hypothetical protein
MASCLHFYVCHHQCYISFISCSVIVHRTSLEAAGLRRNIEEPYVRVTKYSSENETQQAQLWHDINVDYGVVALSDEWAAKHNLRTAQRFSLGPEQRHLYPAWLSQFSQLKNCLRLSGRVPAW